VEAGSRLAAIRFAVLRARYGNGAATITLPIMREHTAALRAGSWVTLDLTWAPDYVTRRRGWQTQGQIVRLEDLDCAWRLATIEEASQVEIPDAPTPELSGVIASASLAYPDATFSIVRLGIRATAINVNRTWRVFAQVWHQTGTDSPVMAANKDITSELDPVPTTISDTASFHDWDATYVRGAGSNEVIVQMFVQILEAGAVVDQRDLTTSYTTADAGPA
jgi:hypothetical protein